MSDSLPKPWEVWHSRFDFDTGGYKYRPVIILSVQDDGTVVMMVTSATNKLSLENDYLLKDWKSAGLEKPSIARADRIAEIPSNYIGSSKRIGKLSQKDIQALQVILQKMVK